MIKNQLTNPGPAEEEVLSHVRTPSVVTIPHLLTLLAGQVHMGKESPSAALVSD